MKTQPCLGMSAEESAFWDVVEYEWDPATGWALLTYEHDDGRTTVVRVLHDRWLP